MDIPKKLLLIGYLSGLKQEKLAQKLEVSFVTLNSWVNGRSQPHPKKEQQIDELYRKYTGQTFIPTHVLEAKKKGLLIKSKAHKNILKTILSRPDLYDQFMLSLTYNTNSIEGSTLSENETAAILFQNKNIPNKTLIEHLEAKNHQAAYKFLLTHLAKKGKLDEALILKLHSILMNGIQDDAGFYRRHGVRIVASRVVTANYLKVPVLMKEIEGLISAKKLDVIGHISQIHARFEKIHPFSDGNGRVGRLLMVAMLLKANLPPAIVLQENKQLYYTYLAKAQTEEDCSLLEDFVCDAIREGFGMFE